VDCFEWVVITVILVATRQNEWGDGRVLSVTKSREIPGKLEWAAAVFGMYLMKCASGNDSTLMADVFFSSNHIRALSLQPHKLVAQPL
jgi:hypothetical protein